MSLVQMLTDFHFLRPGWLLALLPLALLLWALRSTQLHGRGWQQAIAPELLQHLLETRPTTKSSRWWLTLLAIGWLLASLAMAGPAWKKLPQPVQQQQDALILVLDLSVSMYAQDVKPSRITQARRKLLDILKQRREGLTGMIVYSGDAHVVAPLTDDAATVASLVPALEPGIMPSYGSNLSAAMARVLSMMEDSGVSKARVLIISDEILPEQARRSLDLLSGKAVELAVLGIGSEAGAPIPTAKGAYLKDNNGAIVVAQRNRQAMQQFAADAGGRYRDAQLDDSDFEYLLAENSLLSAGAGQDRRQLQREFDTWQDEGFWLVLPLLPLALLAFRRGWLFMLLFLCFSLPAERSMALDWQHLWQTPDQQGASAFQAKDYSGAAQQFSDPAWQGAAHYRAGDYAQAAEAFRQVEGAEGRYNLGNALAKGGNIDAAIAAYQEALEIDPNHSDARTNKERLEALKKQQQQQEQKQQQQQDQNSDQQDKQDSQQQDSQSSGDQSGNDAQNQQQGGDNDQQKDTDGQNSTDRQQQAGNSEQNPAQKPQSKTDAEQQADAGNEQRQEEKQQAASASEQQQADEQQNDIQQGDARQTEQPLSSEEQQAIEQWLRRIPDDPGGLLRRKFEYQYRENQQRGGSPVPPDQEQIW